MLHVKVCFYWRVVSVDDCDCWACFLHVSFLTNTYPNVMRVIPTVTFSLPGCHKVMSESSRSNCICMHSVACLSYSMAACSSFRVSTGLFLTSRTDSFWEQLAQCRFTTCLPFSMTDLNVLFLHPSLNWQFSINLVRFSLESPLNCI